MGVGVRGLAGNCGGLAVHLRHGFLKPVIRLRDASGGEGICFDDVRAGLQKGAMDFLHDIRPRQRQHVAVALQRDVVAGEAFAPVVRFHQPVSLLHGASGAVEHQQAFAQRFG